MKNKTDLEKVCELVGSGDLLSAVKDFAVAILASTPPENLPLVESTEDIITAVRIFLTGLQDPESDLFITTLK